MTIINLGTCIVNNFLISSEAKDHCYYYSDMKIVSSILQSFLNLSAV